MKLNFTEIGKDDEKFLSSTRDYLFGFYLELETVSEAESAIDNFLKSYVEYCGSADKTDARGAFEVKFSELLSADIFTVTTPEKLFNVLQVMQHYAIQSVAEYKEQTSVYDMFAMFFRRLAFFGISP